MRLMRTLFFIFCVSTVGVAMGEAARRVNSSALEAEIISLEKQDRPSNPTLKVDPQFNPLIPFWSAKLRIISCKTYSSEPQPSTPDHPSEEVEISPQFKKGQIIQMYLSYSADVKVGQIITGRTPGETAYNPVLHIIELKSPPNSASKGATSKDGKNIEWTFDKVKNYNKSELIEFARKQILEHFGPSFKLDHFSQRKAFKKSNAALVVFSSPVFFKLEQPEGITDQIKVTVNETGPFVSPDDPKHLAQFRPETPHIAKMFKVDDRIFVMDKGSHFEVHVTHPSRSRYSGGTEAYSISKNTYEKKMLWHEHPNPKAKDDSLLRPVGKDGKPIVVDEFIEVTD